MKINDNTLSITPLIRNILPLIIYDGYYPIFSYEEMTNVSFLNLTLGIGTTTQINNYLKKQKSRNNDRSEFYGRMNTSFGEPKEDNPKEFANSGKNKEKENENKKEENVNNNQNNNYMRQSGNFDNDINEINNLLNEQQRDHYEEPNIEEILERNQRDIKENRYKESILSKYPREQYFNPFITVKEDIKTSPRLSVSKEHFYIPKEPKEADHKDLIKKLVVESVDEKLKNSEDFRAKEREKEKYFELEKLKEKEKLLELEKERLKEKERLLDIEKERIKDQPRDIGRESRLSAFTNDMFIKQREHSEDKYEHKHISNISNLAIKAEEKPIHIEKNNKVESRRNTNNSGIYVRHNFDVTIEKLINIQVLSKLNKCYLTHKFFNDCEFVKSDVLVYSTYDKESSIIDIDMKTSHSVMLLHNENIKDHLNDFSILFNFNSDNNEEVLFGRAILPVEDIIDMTNKDRTLTSTLFVYGTDKVMIIFI
jgi:hypothetical protein